MKSPIRSIFVYGTLRPDDISNAPWTKPFIKGFKYQKCHFKDGIMFHADESYPTVSLLYTHKQHDNNNNISVSEENKKFDDILLNLYKEKQCKGIIGYMLSIDESLLVDGLVDPIKLFDEKLKEADEIEEYPQLYKRSIIKVKPLLDEILHQQQLEHQQQQQHNQDDHLECFIYHRNDCNRDVVIASGDWLEHVKNNPHIINSSKN
ncbi:hypothetical protein DICPUDRAFT_39853 [Dictyostelium purpureum]|uniref:Uncharacterized protein n=1 Tax=Dictyostelium purpureum TaxID=5786 RepID=F0ZX32_DICPU|nr:uncharacterized protein DICPUDRAFT_39853 [Dictyostelium purpureum]EGC31503.1 hypothetical protein DICPUDRAFT_39853 [Dictyostelium purpureum]|eukprot:XP_003291978.1 hypothetical protein DICPUDRAFT_39853 [Dictyostelium purpureum]